MSTAVYENCFGKAEKSSKWNVDNLLIDYITIR